MAFDSYSGYEQQPVFEQKSPVSSVGKALGRSYLYMGIALLVTALVAFVVGYGMTYWMTTSSSAAPFYVLMAAIIVSFIGMVIISFTMVKRLNSSGKSLWPGFIAYSVLMGICLSSFIIAGIDFLVVGEAFGISALAFLSVGLIGYFSKKDLNRLWLWVGVFSMMVLLTAIVAPLMFLFYFSSSAYLIYDLIMSAVILVMVLVVSAIDSYNIKKILEAGQGGTNIELYCAFSMYSDFIAIFVRVLYLLLILGSRRSN